MSITEHTGVIRGTKVNSTTKVARPGVTRSGGVVNPDSAMDATFGGSDVGDFWIPEGWTDTYQLDVGGSLVTADAQSVRRVEGQRSSGTSLDLTQDNGSKELTSGTVGGYTGIYATGADDHLDASTSISSYPITIGWKIYIDGTYGGNNYIYSINDADGGFTDQILCYLNTARRRFLYAGSFVGGGTLPLNSMAWGIDVFTTGTNAQGTLNGTEDIATSAAGSLAPPFNTINLGGEEGGATVYMREGILKFAVIDRTLTAEETTTWQDWLQADV